MSATTSEGLPRARGDSDHIAFYGLLMRGMDAADRLGLPDALRRVGRCRIPGAIYDLGGFPGLRLEDGAVEGELYEVVDPRAYAVMDAFERYDPGSPEASLYVRRVVGLVQPDLDAWVYVYNREVGGARRIESGSWRSHVRP